MAQLLITSYIFDFELTVLYTHATCAGSLLGVTFNPRSKLMATIALDTSIFMLFSICYLGLGYEFCKISEIQFHGIFCFIELILIFARMKLKWPAK